MLRGNIPARVDEKGRLKIPAAFLEELKASGDRFYVTSETGETAKIYPMKAWEEIEAKLSRLSSHNRTKEKFLLWTNYYGQAVEIDGQGRILIPPVLREDCGEIESAERHELPRPIGPFIGDFHVHTTWSDGRLSIRDVVDLYGQTRRFDVIAISRQQLGLGRHLNRRPRRGYRALVGHLGCSQWMGFEP